MLRQHNVDKIAGRITVSHDDYSHLSYYLRCATKSVGIDILSGDLIDYKNARNLSQERKDVILKLAYREFNSKRIVGTIFHPEQGGLCGSGDNAFYNVTQAGSILIGGQLRPVTQIMIFKEAWLKHNYSTPIANQMGRIRQICQVNDDRDNLSSALSAIATLHLLGQLVASMDGSTLSDHCNHCPGIDGNCTCDHGCPTKISTKCSKVHHCDHCKGFNGVCACKSGCLEGIYSKCWVEHRGIVCKGCMQQDIKGARFKCVACANYDLCEKCYHQGALMHDMTHPFHRIDKVGSVLIYLEPRQPSVEATKVPPCGTGFVVMPPPTAPSDVPFVEATPVFDGIPASNNKNGFAKGDAVKIGGLKAENMNGFAKGDAVKIGVLKAENMNGFAKGDAVKIGGLKAENMNGFAKGDAVKLVGVKAEDMKFVFVLVFLSSVRFMGFALQKTEIEDYIQDMSRNIISE